MSTQTIDRNYKARPHTARFLQVFHSGIGTNGHNYRDDAAALATEAGQDDLLDLVPADKVADLRTRPQAELMEKLIKQIGELDLEIGCQAASWTMAMTEHGEWTPRTNDRRDPSRWIASLICKERELRQAAARKAPAPTVTVEDGRYAVEEDGVLKFFKVKNGNRPGFVFLDIQASDEWHAVRNVTRIHAIVALIAQDPQAAMIRYGHELGECGRCGRTLTDEASRAAGIGPVCASK
jgi:hypothetical protein